ncbi:MAG: TonB-dependent receptor plug domain-containing protein [Verrucomicrobiota bacterium]
MIRDFPALSSFSRQNAFSTLSVFAVLSLAPIVHAQVIDDEAGVEELDMTYVTASTLEPRRVVSPPAPLPRPTVVNATVETATRTEKKVSEVPSTIGLITLDDIEQISPLSFDDLIRTEPNVETFGGPRYLGEQIIIRGQSGNAVTVRIDDARQNFVSGHAGQRFFVEPDFLKEVEILRGPGSFLYGSGAAGVVNLSTLDPSDILTSDRPFGLRIRNTYHTNSDEWANSIVGAVAAKNWKFSSALPIAMETTSRSRMMSSSPIPQLSAKAPWRK